MSEPHHHVYKEEPKRRVGVEIKGVGVSAFQ